MANNLKHVGRVIANGRKCLVVYRTLPGDAYNCLIVTTENLPESYHDALLSVVESNAAQESHELAEALARSHFPDGSVMLPSLHSKGRLYKVPTDAVEMTPAPGITVNLAELNQIIAEQQGVAVSDLAIKSDEPAKPNAEVTEIASVQEVKEPLSTTEQLSPAASVQLEALAAQVAALAAQVAQLTAQQVVISAGNIEITSDSAPESSQAETSTLQQSKSTRKTASK